MTYRLAVESAAARVVLELPARDAEFAPGLTLDILDGATVRLGALRERGVVAWQGVSNPSERGEK